MINYKVIERPEPGVVGGGVKKYYASIESDGEFNLSELTTAIEKICTVSGADIRAVLYSLVDVAVDRLNRGTIVRLGDLGSMRVSLRSEGAETAEKFNVKMIKNTRVIFSPGKRIKTMLEQVEYHKVQI
jgi:predicted histone-like DNA-binding protein